MSRNGIRLSEAPFERNNNMNRRIHAKYFKVSMVQKFRWSKSLKTEDKILLAIALFVGASAISLVTVGDAIWSTLSQPSQSHIAAQESDITTDDTNAGIWKLIKDAHARAEENFKKMSEAHLESSRKFAASLDRIDKIMEATVEQGLDEAIAGKNHFKRHKTVDIFAVPIEEVGKRYE